jgi:hypothetical protein
MMRATSVVMRRLFTAFVAAGVAGLVSACANRSISGIPASERYQYTADQRTPYAARVSGTLVITTVNGDHFDGTLDVLQTNADGLVDRHTGIVHGQLTAGAMDFDALLEGDVYRHVGKSVADTVSGSWLDASALGAVASGTFRLERVP